MTAKQQEQMPDEIYVSGAGVSILHGNKRHNAFVKATSAYQTKYVRADLCAPTDREECDLCQGYGEIYGHSDDCNDDLCALNGDLNSCDGKVEPCPCTSRTKPSREAQLLEVIRDLDAALHDVLKAERPSKKGCQIIRGFQSKHATIIEEANNK